MAHLTYVGDSDVGEDCNFGCGTVTCNYDGFQKHRTTIGSHVFVGCNTNFVAPVTVEDGALRGGVGEAVAAFFNAHGYDTRTVSLGIGDAFVEHGTPDELRALCGYDAEGILRALRACVKS